MQRVWLAVKNSYGFFYKLNAAARLPHWFLYISRELGRIYLLHRHSGTVNILQAINRVPICWRLLSNKFLEFILASLSKSHTALCTCVSILDCFNWPLTINFKWADSNISWELRVPDDGRFRLTPSSDQKMPRLCAMVQTELDKNGHQFRCYETTASLQVLPLGSRGDRQSPSMPCLWLLEGWGHSSSSTS